MSKLKILTAGVLLGASLNAAIQASASGRTVTAVLADDIKFLFKTTPNEFKSPPEEYPIIMYNDRVYTSAKFIGEELGAAIDWDERGRYVVITPPEPKTVEKIVEKIVEIEVPAETPEESKLERFYANMPVKYSTNEYEITVTGISKPISNGTERDTKVYVYVENKGSDPIQLSQGKTVVEVDEQPWRLASSNLWSGEWYNDIRTDEYQESYISIERIPDDAKYVHLELQVFINGRTPRTDTVELNVTV